MQLCGGAVPFFELWAGCRTAIVLPYCCATRSIWTSRNPLFARPKPGTVKSQTARSLSKLRDMLSDDLRTARGIGHD